MNHDYKYPFTYILGWSNSRYEQFCLCKRKYYYHRYGKYDTTHHSSKINQLKDLTSLPLAKGTIVHDVIKGILSRLQRTESPIDKDRLKVYVHKLTKEYYEKNTFSEHHYKSRTDNFIDALFEEVHQRIVLFVNSSSFSFILEKALPVKNEWIIEPGGHGETRIEGMKAYCKVDFLFPINGHVFIYDWKTGKSSKLKHKRQMIGYSYWASEALGISKSNITPIIVYLNSAHEENPIKLFENDIVHFPEKIKTETRLMYDYCTNIEKNIPKPKRAFEKTDKINICMYCNFRELCFSDE
ncbi:MAG: PD-(D/E)XK nuclease family protein [Desulfobacteraceae bacterium]|nr:PD-(D/E)XK nuclease family protein [Desulfobacteraceae bacterium]